VSVADLSLAVPAGQCFGFLDTNGVGKTTRGFLTGELEPDGGRAFLNGFDVMTQLVRAGTRESLPSPSDTSASRSHSTRSSSRSRWGL